MSFEGHLGQILPPKLYLVSVDENLHRIGAIINNFRIYIVLIYDRSTILEWYSFFFFFRVTSEWSSVPVSIASGCEWRDETERERKREIKWDHHKWALYILNTDQLISSNPSLNARTSVKISRDNWCKNFSAGKILTI